MPTLAVDGGVVSYEASGTGPRVLLVHGSPGNGKAWLLTGYSYGGVVALAIALRGRVSIGALALLEPVAVPLLGLIGAAPVLHARTRAVFDGYIAAVEGGDPLQVRTMVDFWFGPGTFEHMPEALRATIVREAPVNVRDVRATLSEAYAPAALRRLPVPVTVIVGERSPQVTRTIAQAITAHAPQASLVTLAGATHAMITTHAGAVAQALAGLLPGGP